MTTKTALITGPTIGIGFELAKCFAKDKYNLVLVARDQARLTEVASELQENFGVSVETYAEDLSVTGKPQSIVDDLAKKKISIHALVNNAGFGVYGPFSKTPWKDEKGMVFLNVLALTELTKLLLPEMIEKKSGQILNVASTAAFQPGPLMAVYYATKAYVLYFSEALAEELHGSGVTVTILCPGPTRSGFQKRADMEHSKLFQGFMDEASAVAQEGYRALQCGQRIIVTGMRNKVLAQGSRFLPRSIVTKLVMNVQKRI